MSPELLSALIAALVGGAVGSAITAWASVAIARSQRREEAAKALWNYHYALSGHAAQASAHAGPPEDVSLLKSDFNEVIVALRNAYPFAGYLGPAARKKLFTGAWITSDPYYDGDWIAEAEQIWSEFHGLAERLETELDWAFPRRFLDPARSVGRRISARIEVARVARLKRKKRKQREKLS